MTNVELMKTGTVIKFNEITVKPLKKKKRIFKIKRHIDKKKIWRTMKPYFNEQGSDSDKTTLYEN